MRTSYGLVAVLVFIAAALTAAGCSMEVEEPECTATVEAFVASLAARDAVGLSRTMARDVSAAEAADLAAEILGIDDAIEAEQIELESPIAGGGDWNYMVRVISSDFARWRSTSERDSDCGARRLGGNRGRSGRGDRCSVAAPTHCAVFLTALKPELLAGASPRARPLTV